MKREYTAMKLLRCLFLGLLVLTICVGCDSQAKARRSAEWDDVVAKSKNYYRLSYLENVESARSNLQENAKLIEQSMAFGTEGQAGQLVLAYSHLFVLEWRASNNVAAEANLLRVKYWGLKFAELNNRSLEETMKAITDLSPEIITERVNKDDIENNQGKLPAYVRDLEDSKPKRGE